MCRLEGPSPLMRLSLCNPHPSEPRNDHSKYECINKLAKFVLLLQSYRLIRANKKTHRQMWKRTSTKAKGISVLSLIIMFILSTALAGITSIIVRAIALLFEAELPPHKADIWYLVFEDFWSVILTWFPALLFVPIVLAVFRRGIHCRRVTLIFIGSCFMWMIKSIFSSWLAQAVLIRKIDPKYIGLVQIGSEMCCLGVWVVVASLGWYKKAACDFIIGFALFGCYAGFTIFYSVETFFGVYKITDLPSAFGRSAMFILFSVASSSWCAVSIARVYLGYSRWNLLGCLALSALMAIGVGVAVSYPTVDHEDWISIPALQYVTVCGIAIVGLGAAFISSRSIVNVNDPLSDDENMRFAMSLMTRNDNASSTGTPPMKPISLS